ncbi:MAG: hypothetical protein QOJ59_2573 [Thermomicrobiales bacterium]|jgi:hypothetical protein|nr:hypothetical protein [Thermomicrobiales bacterium]
MTSRTKLGSGPQHEDIGRPLHGDELHRFLALGLVARLACLDSDGWPYNVPVWHEWDGNGFWVIAAKGAAWARFLTDDPRVALTVDEPETLRRVLCQGTAAHTEGPIAYGRWNAIARQMAARYLGSDGVAAYEANTAGLERWLFRIEPRLLVGWHGPGRADRAP